ncbi:MAG: hypothetical protein P8M17_08705 [Saprospiraceae bacterium]|nr:hypothetical protein [bacterium]MDC3219563.1 hypothetical protein [Saprospiraceae bacterium]MDG1434187.1 hypothetical protein [Saprospiraceae bacterium]MDG2419057.1 hypothetical protein [Saprospiraceae bacterium]
MIISQTITKLNEEDFEVDITVTDIPEGYFISIGDTTFSDDGFMRIMMIEMLQLSDSTGGTRTINSGVFTRQEEEDVIKVLVVLDGKKQGVNTQVYF